MQNLKINLLNRRLLFQLLTVCLVLFINGCVPRHPPNPGGNTAPRNTIATINYRWGQNGFINRNRARQGDQVFNGDRVYTEDATSVSVNFHDGGFMQLDANTDPDFHKWFEQGRCIIKALVQFGQVYVETGSTCDFLIDDGHLEALAHTKFNLKIYSGYSVLSVIQGEMRLKRPRRMRVTSRQQLIVYSDGRTKIKPLSTKKIKKILRWRKDKSGWCCANARVFKATAASCKRSRGSFSNDYRKIQKICRIQSEPKGYCCINGKVDWRTQSLCKSRKGQFYNDKRTAAKYCRQIIIN